MIWTFEVEGKPRPKGSLKCLGAGRGKPHNMIESVESSVPWKLAAIRTIRREFGIEPIKNGHKVVGWLRRGVAWEPFGAVAVWAAFYFVRERGVGGEVLPSHSRPWPDADDIGDTDKLCRNLGDALEQSGLIGNDRGIVEWSAAKLWTPDRARMVVSVEER